ncbi:MAG TPA: helix-turn-helix domain-containing protein [Candidatus Paenibacillus intestinavium]|nr:helix-turn-helix domain-containing protein [Candidatus Paenibacillus intestinavium]
MFRAIIADDQMPVLDYLQAKLPWGQLEIELLSVCTDGEEALEACKQGNPDILITDIGMPIMNGLELIEKAREWNPALKTIILSCHEEFHFAQQAVKLNVNDYILKETMDSDQLYEILLRMVSQLKKERELKSQQQQLQNVITESHSTLKTTYLKSLIDMPIWNEEDWIKRAESFGIQLRAGQSYLPILCLLDRFEELELRFGGARQLQFVVENALHEAIKLQQHVVISLNEKTYLLLYSYSDSLKINSNELISQDIIHVQRLLVNHMKMKSSYFVGEKFNSIVTFKKQVCTLINIHTQHFYSGELSIQKYKQQDISSVELFVQYAKAVDDIRSAIQSNDLNTLEQTLRKWCEHIHQQKYPIDMVRGWILKIVTDVELKYSVMQHFLTNFSVEQIQKKIYAIDTLDYLFTWLYLHLEEKIDSFHQSKHSVIRKEIAEAQHYIMNHLCEKISMDEMAKRLHLNATHFSRIFKKETGETFVEYVNRRKMEKAKELLDHSNQSVDQIAQDLAYDNSSYFNKVFRAYSGMSANEYRKRI